MVGLHLAYKIIEAHAGRIDVDSTAGRGTTFRIQLPLTGPAKLEEKPIESVA